MKRPRFTLRIVLLVVTIVAVGMWALRASLLPLPIAESQATKVVIGSSPLQVRETLGPPHTVYTGSPLIWQYRVFGTLYNLYIEFDEDGRVSSIRRLAYLLRNPDD